MSAPAVLPHVDAVTAALTGAGLAVGLGGAPKTVPTSGIYTAVYADGGQALPESLADRRTGLQLLFQVTCVAPTAEKALWAADKTRAALAAPLAVPGRALWRAEELGGPPLARDDDVTPPLYFLPIQYRLRSTT
ncbi:hypothetical protein GCM10010406_21080 [Streptomyces thermolineatus]|uniref:DUF3168 domain-containing protein n=1 Tax=Streptomyces thermolineatus TaxID=44033 RepID=A0ABN3LLN0_9ACTN